jgi:cell pole-organizing protein PopZ
MEEILASIRRIIADDEPGKAPAKAPAAAAAPPPRPAAPPPRAPASPPAPPPAPRAAARPPAPPPNQKDIDSMLAGLDAPPGNDAGSKDDVLDLTEQMAAPNSTAPSFQTIDGNPDVIFSDNPPAAPGRVVDEARRQFAQTAAPPGSLLSSNASAAVDSAFNALAQTVPVQNARTLEDLVREMLRPMLKSWLDDNLPGMVERIVKAEIERVSRGRS